MNNLMRESTELLGQLDIVSTLLRNSDDVSTIDNIEEAKPLDGELASVRSAMDRFRKRAIDLSKDSTASDTQNKLQLGRITYGLFVLSIAVMVVANTLLISLGASLMQLAFCNFGTMILFVLAGVCLLNDISRRNSSGTNHLLDTNHRVNSISDHVDELGRLTSDWNRKLQDLRKNEQQVELSVQQLQILEEETASNVDLQENESRRLREEVETRTTESLGLADEIAKLNDVMRTITRENSIALSEKEGIKNEIGSLSQDVENAKRDLAELEEIIEKTRQEYKEVDNYSNLIQSEIRDLQKTLVELESNSDGLQLAVDERQVVLGDKQSAIDSLAEREQTLRDSIADAEGRLDTQCDLGKRHLELKEIENLVDLEKNQLHEIQKSLESLGESVVALETTKVTLAIGIATLRVDFEELSTVVDQKAEYLSSLTHDETVLAERISSGKKVLESLEQQEMRKLELNECELQLSFKREEIAALQNQRDGTRDEVYDLSREASELQELVERLAKEVEVNATGLDVQVLKIKALDDSERHALEQLRHAENALADIRNETKSNQDVVKELCDAVDNARVRLAEIESEAVRKAGQCDLLDSQIDLKLEELGNIEAAITSFKTREDTLNRTCTEAEGRITVLAEKAEQLAEHLAFVTSSVELEESRRADAITVLEQVNLEIKELQSQRTSLEIDVMNNTTDVSKLRETYLELEQTHISKLEELSILDTRMHESQNALIELTSAEVQRSDVRADIQDLLAEIDSLTERKSDAILEIQRIQASVQLSRSKAAETEDALKQSINELLATEMHLAKIKESQLIVQAETHQLSVTIDGSNSKLAAIQSEILSKEQDRDDLLLQTQRLQQDFDKISGLRTSHDGLLQDLQSQIAASRKELSLSESDLERANSLKQEIRSQEEQIQQLNRDSRELEERILLLERECDAKGITLDRLAANLERCELAATKSESNLREVIKQCELAQEQLAGFEGRKASARKELDLIEGNTKKAKASLDSIAAELNAMEKNKNQTREDLERYSAEVVEAQGVCRQWQEYGEMLRQTNQDLDTAQKACERQLQVLKVKQTSAENELEQNRLAVKNASSQREKLLLEVEGLDRKRVDMIHSEDALKQSVDSKRVLLNGLDTELDRSRMNLDAATLEIEQLRLKGKNEKSLVAELVSQHDELLREISDRSQIHDQQIRRCDDLKSQEQAIKLSLAQTKDKVLVLQEQEKLFSEKRVQWDAMDISYSKKSIEMQKLQQRIEIDREQLGFATKELSDLEEAIESHRNDLNEVQRKLNQGRIEFNTDMSTHESQIAKLSLDIEAKQIELKNVISAIDEENLKLHQAKQSFASLSSQVKEAEEKLSTTGTSHSGLLKANGTLQESMMTLEEGCRQLDSKRSLIVAEISALEEQRNLADARNFDAIQSHLELKSRELDLIEGCRSLELILTSKNEQLSTVSLQIGEGEHQLVQTLQAIAMIGQQRQLAVGRLESDQDTLELTRKALDALQTERLEYESSLLHLNTEIARMVDQRNQLTDDVRDLESQHQALRENLNTNLPERQFALGSNSGVQSVAIEPTVPVASEPAEVSMSALEVLAAKFSSSEAEGADDRLDNVSGQVVGIQTSASEFASQDDAFEREFLSELRDVAEVVAEQTDSSDVWGDLLRVVRVA